MFKIGDKVIVVDAESVGGYYENGDIGVVSKIDSELHGYVTRNDGVEMNVYWREVELYKQPLVFQAGEDVPFKAGDKIKFTESSLASGMIDAKEGDVFTVKESYKRAVTLEELQGCYHVTHFEHVKEEIMNNTEEQEIKWEIGQEVWCLVFGKGKVVEVDREDTKYPVGVDFGNETVHYTVDGKYFFGYHRSLFFSEPKIEAEKFPPKKPFTPTLKKGDFVVVKHKRLEDKAILTVEQEDEDVVWFKEREDGYLKPAWIFFKIGEEINFN